MTKGFGRALALAAAAAAFAATLSLAQPATRGEKPPPRGGVQGARDEGAVPNPVVEEMTRYTTPGPQHQELAELVGRWTTRSRVWQSPDSKPIEFSGSAEYRPIFGFRFLELESAARIDGNESRGLGIFGYDAFKEKYSFYYIHDSETQALYGFGERDTASAAITFTLAMDMPVSGERGKPIRAVLRRLSPNRHVFEMFEKYLDDREWKVLEITYDRAR